MQTGCSSARLEYTSGGRVVASSNLVIPTKLSKQRPQSKDWGFLFAMAHDACIMGAMENKKSRFIGRPMLTKALCIPLRVCPRWALNEVSE